MDDLWSGPTLTAAQMKACEAAGVVAGLTTFDALMEQAGAGVVAAIATEWPGLVPGRALILCGSGNNGGDGYVVARLLAAVGWSVRVLACAEVRRLTGSARRNHDLWATMGEVAALTDETVAAALSGGADLVVDAMFGSGLNRPVEGLHDLIVKVDRWRVAGGRVVAVDLPSGLDADTGQPVGGMVLRADLTVTFQLPYIGHLTGQGPQACGRLRCVPIGLVTDGQGVPVIRTVADAICTRRLSKAPDLHKYDHGHALVLSGGVGRGGAARLAARAALRIGAGAVTIGCPPAALIETAAQVTAIMLDRISGAGDLASMLEDSRITALCLGPGLGTTEREEALVGAALAAADRRTVLDADALTLLSRSPALFARLHPGCVLTPHAGEFARLFPDLADALGRSGPEGGVSKVEITRRAARRAGCTVLLKGPDTVICNEGGDCVLHASVYDRAVPWLATAGSGHVLAGLITGLLAREMDPFTSAKAGAALHAEAGRVFGPGLIAEDLTEVLPRVLRDLLPQGDARITRAPDNSVLRDPVTDQTAAEATSTPSA